MESKDVLVKLREQRGLSQQELAETCADIMAQEGVPREAALAHMNQVLPTLDRWRRDG